MAFVSFYFILEYMVRIVKTKPDEVSLNLFSELRKLVRLYDINLKFFVSSIVRQIFSYCQFRNFKRYHSMFKNSEAK